MPRDSRPPFYPGTKEPLTKAFLQATEGEHANQKMEVYFNPKDITIDKQVPWQEHKNSEGDAPTLEFTAGKGKELTVELLFDMFEERGDVHEEFVSKMEQLVVIDPGLKRPPYCTFTWGSKLKPFKGVIEDLNVKYTMFLPDGTPCRATASFKMKEAQALLNPKEKADLDQAAAQNRQGVQADGSQSYDAVAQKLGYANARDMFKANPQNPTPTGTNAPVGSHWYAPKQPTKAAA